MSYPCPLNMNNLYNYGFISGIYIMIQIITGLIISCRYVSDEGYISLDFIMKSVNNGNITRYIHSNGASYVFIMVLLHIIRSLLYNSNIHMPIAWEIGILIYLLLIIICFFGYVLPWGQMSYWAATVITNLTGIIPGLQKLLLGSYIVDKYSSERFFIFHFILPLILLLLLYVHIYYLHLSSSTNNKRINNIIKVSFYPLMIYSDLRLLCYIYVLLTMNLGFGIIECSHPDNSIEINTLKTPLQIVPEWYFLSYYEILKIIPNKIGGILGILIIFIMLLFSAFTINKYNLDNNFNRSLYIVLLTFLLSYLGNCLPLVPYNQYGSLCTILLIFILYK